jgi:hypothetical protein
MDNETKQVLILILRSLEELESRLHGVSFTLDNTSARALAIEGALNEVAPEFKEKYDRRYAGIQAQARPHSSETLLQEIRQAIDKLKKG